MGIRGTVGLIGAVVVALALAPAAGAEIIYTHGADAPPQSGPWTTQSSLWAMGDNGNDPHQLLSASQVPGTLQALCCSSLQPNSTTMAFQAFDYQYAGSAAGGFGDYYDGMYAYSNGTSTRLSPQPSNGPGSNIADFGVLTSDGHVVYERQACVDVNSPSISCNTTMGSWPDTGGASTAWAWTGGGPNQTAPSSFAADPANGGLLAYNSDLDAGQGGSGGGSVSIANQSGTQEALVFTSTAPVFGTGPAWSPDGSQLVFDSSDPTTQPYPAGIYVVAGARNSTPHELLADPGAGSSDYGRTFGNPIFAGAGEIVFEADDNLWWISPSCTPATCTFPASAHQLTTDGTNSDQDSLPSWTSKTITGPTSPPPPPGTKFKVTLTAGSGQKVVKQKGISIAVGCNLACGIAIVANVQIKGTKKPLHAYASGTLAANHSQKVTLKLSKKDLKAIKTALAKHKKVTAKIAAAAKDAAGTKTTASSSFSVKH